MTRDECDALILSSLPATFIQLCAKARGEHWRTIDRGLQRLRKRGLIAFKREGRSVIWSKVAP